MLIKFDEIDGCTGITVKKQKFKLPPPGTYFETLWSGVEAWFKFLSAKSYFEKQELPLDTLDDFASVWSPMSYETSQSHRHEVWKEGKVRRYINISVYRLPSGRYEVTAYLS